MAVEEHKQISDIYLRLADVIFGVIIAASFFQFQDDLVPFVFSFNTMMLLVAYIIVVLSWIGYHKAVEDKPHKDWSRFVIDLVLLFLYFQLIFTRNLEDFIWTNMLIFGLYLVWVIKRRFEYKPEEGKETTEIIKIIRSVVIFIVLIGLYYFYSNMEVDNSVEIFFGNSISEWGFLGTVLVINLVYRIIIPIAFNSKSK